MSEHPQADDHAARAGATRSQLLSNSKWNVLAFLVSLAANFVTIPFVVNAIGMADFGSAGLVLAALAPLMLIGTVLGQAALREVSHRFAAGDMPGAQRIFSSALTLCTLASAAVLVIVALFGGSLVRLFGVDGAAVLTWHLNLVVATIGWLAQQLVLVLQSTVAATQKYASMAVISVVATSVNAAVIMIGVVVVPTGLGYLAGTTVGFVAALLIWGVLVHRRFPWLFPLSGAGRPETRALLAFGKWQGAGHLIGAVGIQMDRYVLGALTSFAVVGQYNVAMRLQEVMQMAVLKAGEVLFPHFSVTATDSIERRAAFFVSASWILNTVAACVLVPLIPLSEDILALWLHDPQATGAAPILRTLVAAGVIGCGVNVFSYFAMGTGQPAMLAKVTAAYSVLTIVLTALLIHQFGARGAGVGALIAGILRLWLVLLYSRRSFDGLLSVSRVVVCTLSPLIAGLLVSWLWYRTDLVSPHTWPLLGLSYTLIAVTVALASLALTCISAAGRTLVLDTLRAARSIVLRRA